MAVDVHTNGVPLPLEVRLDAAQAEGLDANVRRMLRFVGPRGPLEFQALGVREGRFETSRAAHSRGASDAVALCAQANKWTADGVYVVPVQLRLGVETRRSAPGAWYDMRKGESTTDSDVAARLVLGIDCDVRRPSKISATDEEMSRSIVVAARAWSYVAGIASAIALAYVHSGNGRQIWLALDAIPANDETKLLCASILVGLDALLSTDAVAIDLKLSDAKRLLPACGTTKKKGAPGIPERPHRQTAIVAAEQVKRLSLDQLRELRERLRGDCDEGGRASMDKANGIKPKPGPAKAKATSSYSSTDSPFDRANALDPKAVAEWLDLIESGDLRCPGCGESEGVAILDHGLHCHHNRCNGKGKEGFRTNVDLVMEVHNVDAPNAYALLAEKFDLAPLPDRKATAGDEGQGEREALADAVKPTAEDPLRGLVHLAKVAVVGRERIVALSETSVVYAWEPVARCGWIIMFGGGVGSGKTSLLFLVVAARMNVGAPVAVLGHEVTPAPLGKWVVLIEGEIDDLATAKKIRAALAMLAIDEAALDRIIIVARKGVYVGDAAWVDVERLIEAGLVSDIFLDTIARATRADSNDEQEQAAVFERVTKSIQLAPVVDERPICWTVAHTRKGDGIELDDIAGSAQRVAQMDSVLMVRATKTPAGKVLSSTVYFKKLRHDPEDHPEPVTITLDRDALGRPRCRTDAVVEDKRPLDTRVEELLRREGPLTRRDVATRLQRSVEDTQPAIETLFKAGRLTGASVLKKNGKQYSAIDVRRERKSTETPEVSVND